LEDRRCKEAFFMESRLKKFTLEKTDLTRADFFRTQLKGIDLSSCVIKGIMVSDTYRELHGAKIDAFQAIDLVSLLGVTIV